MDADANPLNERLTGLTENRARFLSVVRARIHDRTMAEDARVRTQRSYGLHSEMGPCGPWSVSTSGIVR